MWVRQLWGLPLMHAICVVYYAMCCRNAVATVVWVQLNQLRVGGVRHRGACTDADNDRQITQKHPAKIPVG
jgi:hypothetical protein